jgi:stage II sporulation protein D
LRALTLSLALALMLLVPASASGAVRHVVRGAGYGHGVGMSQYGAFGLAREGRDYRAILAHYYRGTDLGQADARPIRVLLRAGASSVSFSGASQVGTEPVDPEESYRVKPGAVGELEVRDARRHLVARFAAPLTVTGADGTVRLLGRALNGVEDGGYRGVLELRPSSFGGLLAVNVVGLDDYLLGVVPGEVPPTWPMDALRAQAVAARSYALATNAGGPAFDQYPDTRSQVYRGLVGERPSTTAAVRETAGEVLRYGGTIATTFFFSTSGGRTENVENAFPRAAPRPYLVSVEDPFDGASPRHRWRLAFTQRQMQRRLRGLVKGRFRRIRVVRRGASPRIVEALVTGTRGSTRVHGSVIRARLALPDTWAYFARISTRRPSRAARAAWLAAAPGGRALLAAVEPAQAGGPRVERRDAAGRWSVAGRLAPRADGRFRFGLRRPGVYRLVADGASGPAVRVR